MPQPTHEQWLPVPDYEGYYEVSDHGNVRSVDRVVNRWHGEIAIAGVPLSPALSKVGQYPFVALSREGKQKSHKVHRLVLEAFVGPCPEGMEACHWDDDKTNNHLSNLRWASKSENMHDRVRNGRHYQAVKTHCHRGHEFTPENTIIKGSGTRGCRECVRLRNKKYYDRDKRNPPVRGPKPTHCKWGHEFTESNTYVKPNGARACRICKAEANRRAKQRRRENRQP